MVIQMPNPLTQKTSKVLHNLQQLPFWRDLPSSVAKTILKEAEAFLYYQSFKSTLGQGRSLQRIYDVCEPYSSYTGYSVERHDGAQFTSIARVVANDFGQAHRFRRAYEEALRYLPPVVVEEGIERGNTWGDKGISYTSDKDMSFGKYTSAVFSLLPAKVSSKTAAQSWWDKVEYLYANRPRRRA